MGSLAGSSLVAPASIQPCRVSVELAGGLEPLAAGMRHGAGGFFEQGALGRDGPVDPAADHLAGEAEVVAVGVEAEERDAEAVLAARGPVAASGVAAGPHEDRHDVEPEADRGMHGRLGDLDRHGDRLGRHKPTVKRRRAVGGRDRRPRPRGGPAWDRPASASLPWSRRG